MGTVWTALTFAVMLALAWGKIRTGRPLGNPVLRVEGKVTLVDAGLAGAVLAGLVLNSLLGWWWADPLAGSVIIYYIYYAVREACHAFKHTAERGRGMNWWDVALDVVGGVVLIYAVLLVLLALYARNTRKRSA
ncbi:cation transporter [Arthrobacter sp. UYCu723]